LNPIARVLSDLKDVLAWLQCPTLEAPQDDVGQLLQAGDASALQSLTSDAYLLEALYARPSSQSHIRCRLHHQQAVSPWSKQQVTTDSDINSRKSVMKKLLQTHDKRTVWSRLARLSGRSPTLFRPSHRVQATGATGRAGRQGSYSPLGGCDIPDESISHHRANGPHLRDACRLLSSRSRRTPPQEGGRSRRAVRAGG